MRAAYIKTDKKETFRNALNSSVFQFHGLRMKYNWTSAILELNIRITKPIFTISISKAFVKIPKLRQSASSFVTDCISNRNSLTDFHNISNSRAFVNFFRHIPIFLIG
jgi:hypothetical protein